MEEYRLNRTYASVESGLWYILKSFVLDSYSPEQQKLFIAI